MLVDRLSIRWRLTIGAVLIATVLFGAAAFAISNQLGSLLHSTTKTLLEHDAAPFVAQIRAGVTTVDRPGHAQLVAVINPAGFLQRSTLPESLSTRAHDIARLTGEPHELTAGDDTYLVLVSSVASDSGNWIVISARNLDASELISDRISGSLLVGALVLIAGFGVASWLVASAALRPVTRMRLKASELAQAGSTDDLPVGPARDEIARLAATLNEFIDVQRITTARERQLVSDASHELRGPLAILLAQLELAHLNSGDAVALEAQLSSAENSAMRISQLASSLLELSEVEAHPGSQASSWSELCAELGASADRARIMAMSFAVVVNFDVDGHRDNARYGLDVTRFGRVVDNLSRNSIAAMRKGGELRLHLSQGSDSAELTVRDDGTGLPADFLPTAFDRFTRPDESRTVSAGGSGLGLAIVRAVVTAARGTVMLENVDDGGACARVRLPEVPGP